MRKNFHPPGKEVCAFFFFFFEDLEEQSVFPESKQILKLLDRITDATIKIRKIVSERSNGATNRDDLNVNELQDRLKDIVASDARIKESIVRATTRTTDSE